MTQEERFNLFNFKTVIFTQTKEAAAAIKRHCGPALDVISTDDPTGSARLLKAIAEQDPVLLAYDNTEAGREAAHSIVEIAMANKTPIWNATADICGPFRETAQEAEAVDSDQLKANITEAIKRMLEIVEAIDDNDRKKKEKAPAEIFEDFLDEIHGRSYEPVRTSITDIDRMLHGGFLRRTLVTLGAAPGAGKTALAQWLFEGMAAAGTDVLYINLEMDRAQLLARSISRIAWKRSDKKQKGGFSSLDVMRAYDWTPSQQAAFTEAIEEYKKETLPHFMYNPDGVTNHIDSIIEACQQETNRLTAAGRPAPIICIDYLQIIDTDERETAEGVKNAMFRLKDFARNNNTVVFLIIANNRASNKAGVADMESGRDTSAIEYSGDLMLGLVYTAIEDGRTYTWTERDEAGRIVKDKNGTPAQRSKKYDLETIRFLRRQAEDRREDPPAVCNEISLKVLKNRFGAAERRANFIFDGEHSTFSLIEREDRKDDNRGEWQQGSFDDITASF